MLFCIQKYFTNDFTIFLLTRFYDFSIFVRTFRVRFFYDFTIRSYDPIFRSPFRSVSKSWFWLPCLASLYLRAVHSRRPCQGNEGHCLLDLSWISCQTCEDNLHLKKRWSWDSGRLLHNLQIWSSMVAFGSLSEVLSLPWAASHNTEEWLRMWRGCHNTLWRILTSLLDRRKFQAEAMVNRSELLLCQITESSTKTWGWKLILDQRD